MNVALVDALLAVTPHALVRPTDDDSGDTLVWTDARGLPARTVAAGVLAAARAHLDAAVAPRVRVGVSRIAVAAELAARSGKRAVTGVAPRQEMAFLAAHPLRTLLATRAWPTDTTPAQMARVVAALADVGVVLCGDLAALAPDAIAVRYGAAGAALWRLARGDDPRRLFIATPRELPSASLEWTTYELRDPERLAFVAHRLVERVITEVRGWGDSARALVLRFALGGGSAHETVVRGARPSADVATWSRLVRDALEHVVLPDGVVGLAIRIDSAGASDAPQGDLFDRGFQSGAAAEAAVSRLVDDGAGVPVRLSRGGHALPERRVSWQPLDFREVTRRLRSTTRLPDATTPPPADEPPRVISLEAARQRQVSSRAVARGAPSPDAPPEVPEPLALRVLPAPRPIVVTARVRRGARVPVRYRERLADGERAPRGQPLVEIVTALGPDRVVVGQELGEPVHRAYWQCLTIDGRLVLLYEDTAAEVPNDTEEEHGSWFLQGWWD